MCASQQAEDAVVAGAKPRVASNLLDIQETTDVLSRLR